jgi:aspartate/methionine/tyrosine aminotransferase
MNPLAEELNRIIHQANPGVLDMLSDIGRNLYFPKGILSQSAEAKEKAHRINATIGIARENGHTMRFDSVMGSIKDITASEALTYAPSFGIPALRKHWREEIYQKNPSLKGKEISLPVVTCGITHGVSAFADLWIDPGDVVVLPDKMWGNYSMILSVRKGARLSHYPLFTGTGGFNVRAFEETLNQEAGHHDKIIVLLNFPQNPTGYTPTRDEADEIVRVLTALADKVRRLIVVLDDAYFGLFYEAETQKESLFAKLAGQHPNMLAVKLDGATKEHYVWGLRVGFVTYGTACQGDCAGLYDALEKKTAGNIRGNISNASHLSQSLVLRSLQDPNNLKEREEKFGLLKSRALKVKHVLDDSKYADAWQAYPFNSGYFMCLQLKTVEAEPLRVHLLDQYGVGLIALGDKDLRVAFSCIDENQVQELFDTILQGVRDLEKTG